MHNIKYWTYSGSPYNITRNMFTMKQETVLHYEYRALQPPPSTHTHTHCWEHTKDPSSSVEANALIHFNHYSIELTLHTSNLGATYSLQLL